MDEFESEKIYNEFNLTKMKFILLNINRNRKIVDFLGGKIVDKIVGKKRNW